MNITEEMLRTILQSTLDEIVNKTGYQPEFIEVDELDGEIDIDFSRGDYVARVLAKLQLKLNKMKEDEFLNESES